MNNRKMILWINNSLDALKRLDQETCPATYMPDFDKKECIEIIRKDLEVLEILKKHLSIKDFNPVAYPSLIILSGGPIDDLEEARKIKEWLEDE